MILFEGFKALQVQACFLLVTFNMTDADLMKRLQRVLSLQN